MTGTYNNSKRDGVDAAEASAVSATAITVFTPYFAARTAERQAEFDLCLRHNLACDAIDQLVLLIDDGHIPPMAHPKLLIRRFDSRPTYLQWLDLTDGLPAGQLSILANTDIYFDETLPKVQTALATIGRFLALSRYEKVADTLQRHNNPKWSQDVWGLRTGQALGPSLRKSLDIPLGVPRCDNKIAYLFAVHGWAIHNPMNDVRTVHVHETQQRHYNKTTDMTVMGGVAYVQPSASLADASKLEFEVWTRNAGAVQSVKINGSLDRWLEEIAADSVKPTALLAGKPRHAVDRSLAQFREAPLPVSGSASGSVGDARQVQQAMREGDLVFSACRRFKVYRWGGRCMAVDSLSTSAAQWLPKSMASLAELGSRAEALLAAFVPPVVDIRPIRIGERPHDKADAHFWQYPAATERQAFENHLAMARGSNVDAAQRVVHTYLALPWATYIDKKHLPDEVVRLNGPRLAGLAALAQELGFHLKVHTVCQQIHWRRFVDTFIQIGITDLHLSHDEQSIDPAREGWPFRVHSWALFAPNIEVSERRLGLVIGKPVAEKRYLASFIGAHMPHYRTDVRLRLAESAQDAGRDDILVDLGKEWHFNKMVYQEQVQHELMAETEHAAERAATLRYNQVLSDSVFSLCPEGAGPNTLRIWESLAVGAIPVVIDSGWRPPIVRTSADRLTLQDCFIFWPRDQISDLWRKLERMSNERLEMMQKKAMALYQSVRQLTAW